MRTITLQLPDNCPMPTPEQKALLERMLPYYLKTSLRPLPEVFAEIGQRARERGLTDEILADLLKDEL